MPVTSPTGVPFCATTRLPSGVSGSLETQTASVPSRASATATVQVKVRRFSYNDKVGSDLLLDNIAKAVALHDLFHDGGRHHDAAGKLHVVVIAGGVDHRGHGTFFLLYISPILLD
jgi:hypothetical protein